MGLRAAPAFVPASAHRTVLRRPDAAPLMTLRTAWRGAQVVGRAHPSAGSSRAAGAMLWTRSARSGPPRRSQAATAWRG
jgi:hypothetical protein